MTTFGQRLIESAKEAVAISEGRTQPARVYAFEGIEVAEIRKRLGLSQQKFAERFGLSVATLRDWEQGRYRPEGAAASLLRVIDYAPETVSRALNMTSVEQPSVS